MRSAMRVDFPVVVGGGVTANDMEMLAHSKAAGSVCGVGHCRRKRSGRGDPQYGFAMEGSAR